MRHDARHVGVDDEDGAALDAFQACLRPLRPGRRPGRPRPRAPASRASVRALLVGVTTRVCRPCATRRGRRRASPARARRRIAAEEWSRVFPPHPRRGSQPSPWRRHPACTMDNAEIARTLDASRPCSTSPARRLERPGLPPGGRPDPRDAGTRSKSSSAAAGRASCAGSARASSADCASWSRRARSPSSRSSRRGRSPSSSGSAGTSGSPAAAASHRPGARRARPGRPARGGRGRAASRGAGHRAAPRSGDDRGARPGGAAAGRGAARAQPCARADRGIATEVAASSRATCGAGATSRASSRWLRSRRIRSRCSTVRVVAGGRDRDRPRATAHAVGVTVDGMPVDSSSPSRSLRDGARCGRPARAPTSRRWSRSRRARRGARLRGARHPVVPARAARGAVPRRAVAAREVDDIRGDLHCHTLWSDGRRRSARWARRRSSRGYEYLAICDHTPAVNVVPGLDPDAVRRQGEEIRAANEGSRRSGCCAASSATSAPTARSTCRTTCWRSSTGSWRRCTRASGCRAELTRRA